MIGDAAFAEVPKGLLFKKGTSKMAFCSKEKNDREDGTAFCDLNETQDLLSFAPSVSRYSDSRILSLIPVPDKETNKYLRGKLIVVAGGKRYPGAACLTARAGQRSGAGYTMVYTAPANVDLVRISGSSLVVDAWPVEANVLNKNFSEKPWAAVVGPGFEGDKAKHQFLTLFMLKETRAPLAVDGGSLNALQTNEGIKSLHQRAQEKFPTILTPHAGEAGRLCDWYGITETDPALRSYELARLLKAIVVLKGPNTYVSDGTRIVEITEGTAALAKAGTGDVLAGMIGGFVAQGIDPFDASVLGVVMHARAGKLAAQDLTSISVIPEDVIQYIPKAFLELAQ